MDLFKLKAPFNMCIVGQSGSGKTVYCRRLLQNLDNIVQPSNFERIIYAYSIYQPIFDELAQEIPKIQFCQGLPAVLNSTLDGTKWNDGLPSLLILDDLAYEMESNPMLEILFTRSEIVAINLLERMA